MTRSAAAVLLTLVLAANAAAQAGSGSRWRTQQPLPGSRASAFLNLLGNSAAIRYQGIVRPQIQAETTSREQRQSLDKLSGEGPNFEGIGGRSQGGGFGLGGGNAGGAGGGYGSGYYGESGGGGVGEPYANPNTRRLYSSGSFAPRPRGLSAQDQGVKARFLDRGRFFPALRSTGGSGSGGGGAASGS